MRVILVPLLTAGLLVPTGAATAAAPRCDSRVATIVGTAGSDILVGTPGPDVIVGLGGWDSIDGRGGDDVLCGAEGSDELLGGDGDDRLFGGLDALGGMPGDTQRSGDVLSGGAGDDWLDPGHDPRPTRGAEKEDHEVVSYQDSGPVTVDLGVAPGRGRATGDGTDVIVLGPTQVRVLGSRYGDRMLGSSGDDWFDTQGGSDVLVGRGGDDFLLSDGGYPTIRGDDRLLGGHGDDYLQSSDGDDRLAGGDGDDRVRSSGGHAVLFGGAGDDDLDGRLATDGLRVVGGPGLDLLELDQFGVRETVLDQRRGRYTARKAQETATGRLSGLEEFRLDYGRYRFLGSSRAETVDAAGSRGLVALGRGGDDVLVGSRREPDRLDGGAGSDELDGTPGEDVCLRGERGTCVV